MRGVVIIALCTACARATTPSTSLEAGHEPAPASDDIDSTPCDALAQHWCEPLALPCARVRAVIAAAGTEASQCERLDRELAVVEVAGPDAQVHAAEESWERFLADSRLPPDRVEALLSGEHEGGAAAESIDVDCPDGTQLFGAPPPAGARVSCVASDGLPHGPFASWNARGEIVQLGEYDRGRLVDPGFVVPESRDVPLDTFACPHGTTPRSRVDGNEQAKWCERKNGKWHGPALVWHDGLVTRFAVYEDGRETRSFVLAE